MAKNSSTGKTKPAATPPARKSNTNTTKATAAPAAAVKGSIKGNNTRKVATAGVAANRPPARARAATAKAESTAMGLRKKSSAA